MIKIKSIPYETARRAYMGTSFSPEERATDTIVCYEKNCENSIKILKYDGLYNEGNFEIIQNCFNYYHKLYIDWLNKRSRCMSTMITGPANFPVRSNRKKINYEQSALELLYNYSIIDNVRKRINRRNKKAAIQERVESGNFSIHIIAQKPGVKIVNNTAMERVQIFFDKKPNTDMRKKLSKEYAFRWAPSLGAWQRKNTANGISAAINFSEEI